MLLFIDLDRQAFIASATVSSKPSNLRLKRGDTGSIRVQFVQAGQLVTLPNGALVELGIKEVGKYDTTFLAFADGFSDPVDPATEYASELLLNGSALNDALGKDLDDANDVEFIDGNLEVTWDAAGDGKWLSTETIQIRIHNDVIRGDEGSPFQELTPDAWLAARAVRFDAAQTLSNAQKEQAHVNMGWPAYDDLDAANAALAPGKPFYDRDTEGPNITTA